MNPERGLRVLMTADAVGGVWTYALQLARALEPHGVQIALAVMGPSPSAPQRRAAAELSNLALFEKPCALEWMERPWMDVNRAGQWLLELAEGFQPDVIHLNGYVHAALPWPAPVVVVAHSCVLSWWRAVKGKNAPASYREYRRRVELGLKCAGAVVAPSLGMLAQLREHYTFATPASVVSNASERTFFQPRTKRAFIASAGRLWDEAKNIALLERIAPRLAWPVALAGAASMQGAASSSSGPNVRRLGALPQRRLARVLGAASIYAAPAHYEPFGLSILEAAHAGCALVLADIPSLRENWEGAAVFVPSDDEAGWADALQALTQNRERRTELATAAVRRAHRFSPARMAAEYLRVYEELTGWTAQERLALVEEGIAA